jgi:outer membrane protein assembly factor BamB
MRRVVTTVGLAGLCALLSGCWVQVGFDAGRTSWNEGESTITSENVAELVPLWDTEIPGGSSLTAPVSANGRVFVTGAGVQVAGLDAGDGSLRWTHEINPEANVEAALWDRGAVLVPANVFTNGGLFKINGNDGRRISGDFGINLVTDLAHHDDRLASMIGDVAPGFGFASIGWKYSPYLFFSFPGNTPGRYAIVGDRIMWSLSSEALGFSPACPDYPPPAPPDTGCAPDWRTDLGAFPAGPTALGEDQVVYTDASGTVTVLDTATGAVQWTAEAGATELRRASVAGDTILVGTFDGRLLAYAAGGCGAATCTPLWEASLGGAANGAPAVGGDVVYVGVGHEIQAFALDGCGATLCGALTSLTAATAITGGPIVDDGRVIAGTAGGHVMAWALPG